MQLVRSTLHSPARAARLRRLRGLMAIVDGSAPEAPLALVDAFLRGGAPVIQLRLKTHADAALLEVARAATARCRAAGALLIVNDRAEVAAAAGADGVHLGQGDLPVPAARALVGPDALIGLSAYSDAELDAAPGAGADYLGFGAVFATGTKDLTPGGGPPLPPPQGLAGLARAARRSALPLVAIGGITLESAGAIAAAGATGAAVISWLSHHGEVEARTRAFIAAFAAGAARAPNGGGVR